MFRKKTYRNLFLSISTVVMLCMPLANYNPASGQSAPKTTEQEQPNMDGLVEVSFKIDAAGKIQIVHINSTSPQLTEYVVRKLSKIKLSSETAPDGKVITYRFVFKKQA